jgi:hypothetical protein
MAQRFRDLGEFLRRSLCAAAESVAVADDGLARIWIRLAQAQSSAAADDREIAVRGARSARADRPRAGRGYGGRLTAHKIRNLRELGPGVRQPYRALPVASGQRCPSEGRTPKPRA